MSTASTQATDTDDGIEVVLSDDDEQPTPVQAPSAVWVQPLAGASFVPVCVAFVPVVQQPVLKKLSRSARRRQSRATNRRFWASLQNGKQNEVALDYDVDAEFDDRWQVD